MSHPITACDVSCGVANDIFEYDAAYIEDIVVNKSLGWGPSHMMSFFYT